MPGMKLSSYDDLEQFISDVAKGNDTYAAQREKVNMIINSYNDGNKTCSALGFKKGRVFELNIQYFAFANAR